MQYYKIFTRSIHNQSYITLKNKYNNLLKQNNFYKQEINNLNNNILKLNNNNNKLSKENKIISEELDYKNKFYNLYNYKIYYTNK